MPDSGVRLSEVLVALSTATDLGLGQPAEHMVRAARIGLRIGERLGLTQDELAALYDVSLLTYVGCPIFGNEAATLFGDDIDFRARAIEVDLAGPRAVLFMMRRAGAGTSPVNRVRQLTTVLRTNGRAVVEQMANHCSAAGELADRLGLSPEVRAGIEQSYARWDGRGVPAGISGDALALSARIAHVAEACEVFERVAGVDAAVEMVRARRARHFDPAVVAAVQTDPRGLFGGIDQDAADEILDAEPVERAPLSDSELDTVLEAIGDFCDLRCDFFAGHSRGTADLVTGALTQLRTEAAELQLARRAALIHDLGRFGVPGSVWDKPGPLNSREMERVRMHVYYIDRIFARPEPLHRIGLLAGTHHERMDGSGYHRGLSGAVMTVPARVLAAADAYHAMTQPRPYRAALGEDAAAKELRRDARDGRLDQLAVDAVLVAAGQTKSLPRVGSTAVLTPREIDVLRLLAQGLPNKSIAKQLDITPKTTGNHVEHIYSKLNVTNRAAATMRAIQDRLI
jgi:HD-GYP domain-containing protein (c-di-GMP phosphodiesterase class II)